MVAMEALACGTPVVAFRVGALPEIIQPNVTGFLVDTIEEMADAIRFYEAHGFRRDDGQVRGSRCTRGYVRELTR